MTRPTTLILVAVAALAWTAPALAQTELTEEGVQAAIMAPDFQQAFGACFAGIDHPAEVTLVLIINETGAASLSKSEPLFPPATTTCLQGAVGKLQFPATGNNFEITYPLAVPEVAAAGTTHPVTTATPVYAVQPVAAVKVQDDSWKPVYASGTRKIIAGSVLLGVGAVVFALPGLVLVAYGLACENSTNSLLGDSCRLVLTIPGGILLTAGVIMIIIGIINLARGSAYRRKAIQMRDGVGFIPRFDIGMSPDGQGAAMMLTWRF